jgi:hypothetical protein
LRRRAQLSRFCVSPGLVIGEYPRGISRTAPRRVEFSRRGQQLWRPPSTPKDEANEEGARRLAGSGVVTPVASAGTWSDK